MWLSIVTTAWAFEPQTPKTVDESSAAADVVHCGEVLRSSAAELPSFPTLQVPMTYVSLVGQQTVFRVHGVVQGEVRGASVALDPYGLDAASVAQWDRFNRLFPPGPGMRFEPGELWILFARRSGDALVPVVVYAL